MITLTVGPLSSLQARPYTETLVERFEPVAQNTGVFGAGMVGMAMMVPNLNFAGGAPNSQAAGTAGGGGLPTDGSITTAALSLALVPLGLAAHTAVFDTIIPSIGIQRGIHTFIPMIFGSPNLL